MSTIEKVDESNARSRHPRETSELIQTHRYWLWSWTRTCVLTDSHEWRSMMLSLSGKTGLDSSCDFSIGWIWRHLVLLSLDGRQRGVVDKTDRPC